MGRRLVPLFGAAGVLVTLSFLRLRFSAEEAVARSNDVPSPSLSVPGGMTRPMPEMTTGPGAVAASLTTTTTTSTTSTVLEVVTPKPVDDTRRYDFVFCANIVGTLGNALQALKAFLIIAKRVQDRGWRVLVQLPALGLREMDWAAFDKDQNGTALGEVLELTELRKLFEIDEASDAVAATRGCWAQGCDVSIWSLAQVHSLWLAEVEVPHLWLGPGKEKWMFEQLLDNLGALSNNRPTGHMEPLRIHWEMQRYSPSRCAPWVYGYLERQIASALVLREAEEPEACAFVYVGHIIHREGWWKLKSFNRWAFAHPDRLRADIPTVAGKIGQLLQEYKISCANFYVKLLGLTGQNFVDLVHQGAEQHGVNFTAKRVKKANCKLCMEGNTALLRRAANAPLLLAEPESFWPDLPAERLRQRGKPVAYIYAELLQKRRWDSWLERFVEPPPNITLRVMDCPWPGQIYRGSCVTPKNGSDGQVVDPNDGTYECWPDMD
ncbi:unnamed protein product [Cladocopium goreaui]|uniref:Uncharacterized protein n=1 Tax=Cladocopium goreaui TaxID=2562237 RepID=A0A9P1LZD2_9DINO|nr:unnamed protein product [Cladocopium goreaui]